MQAPEVPQMSQSDKDRDDNADHDERFTNQDGPFVQMNRSRRLGLHPQGAEERDHAEIEALHRQSSANPGKGRSIQSLAGANGGHLCAVSPAGHGVRSVVTRPSPRCSLTAQSVLPSTIVRTGGVDESPPRDIKLNLKQLHRQKIRRIRVGFSALAGWYARWVGQGRLVELLS